MGHKNRLRPQAHVAHSWRPHRSNLRHRMAAIRNSDRHYLDSRESCRPALDALHLNHRLHRLRSPHWRRHQVVHPQRVDKVSRPNGRNNDSSHSTHSQLCLAQHFHPRTSSRRYANTVLQTSRRSTGHQASISRRRNRPQVLSAPPLANHKSVQVVRLRIRQVVKNPRSLIFAQLARFVN